MPLDLAVHAWFAVLAAIPAAAILAFLVVARIRGGSAKLAIDRAVLAAEVAILLAVATGLLRLLGGATPDPLHFLYAALALWALPVARAWRGFASGPRTAAMALGGIALLAFLLRLAQTG
jgi:hypothetical protein